MKKKSIAIIVVLALCAAIGCKVYMDDHALTIKLAGATDTAIADAADSLIIKDYGDSFNRSFHRMAAYTALSPDSYIVLVGEVLEPFTDAQLYSQLAYEDKKYFADALDSLLTENANTKEIVLDLISYKQLKGL